MWFRSQQKGSIFRPALVLLSVATIAFPPNVFADAVTFQWNGSTDNNFSNATNWTCDPTCAASPDNTAAGASVDAIINSGQPDDVLLDTPSVITSLGLGGASPTSTLTTNGPSLTLGTPTDYRENVLAIGNGGTLNINNANVTLDLSGRDGFGSGSGALVDSGGAIYATNATLKLQNSAGDGIGSNVTNNGSINLDATSSLSLNGDVDFAFNGNGLLNLSGATVAGSGSASLTNGSDHMIFGNGEIDPHFNNAGYLEASGGALSVLSLDDLNHHGVLTQGTFTIDDGAQLKYSSSKTVHDEAGSHVVANDITSIGAGAELDLNGSGQVLNTFGGEHDAVSNTLTSVDGNLTLNYYADPSQAATLTLANQLTNRADVNVYAGSSLTTQGFRNYANEFTSSCGCGASFQLVGGNAQINGDLSNHAAIVDPSGFAAPSVEIGMDQGSSVHVTGDVLNSATSANIEASGSSAYMWLDGQSSLTVDGNLTNDSHGMGGYGYSPAEIDIDSSSVTVSKQVSNLGGSAILMDSYDGAGSTLTAAGGLVNSNSFVLLFNGSTLNAGQTSPAAAQQGQPTWGLQNVADDNTNPSGDAQNISLLAVGFPQVDNSSSADDQYNPAPSTLNVTGGLLNQATSSNNGYSSSIVNVDSGSTLNADGVLNLATVSAGIGDAETEISVAHGSTLNITTPDHTGVLTNSASPGAGFAFADVDVSGGSTLTADSVVNQFTSSPEGVGAATISVDASTMTVNNTFNNLGGVLNLTNRATVTVNGQFTNDANGIVSLDGNTGFPSVQAADGLTGSVLNTNGFSNSGQVNLNQESTLNNTGGFQNFGTVTIDNHSTLNITANGGADIGGTVLASSPGSLTNSGTIAAGDNGGGGNKVLVQGDVFNTAPGVVNIHGEDDAMTVAGQFWNSGSVSIGNGATVQAESYTQTDGQTDIGQGGTLLSNVDLTGGILSGDGTIVGNVTVDGGTLAPGDPQSIDIIGDYTQTLLGILDVDLAGLGAGEYDQINVMSDDQHPDGGHVSLGGTLKVTLEDGFGAGIEIGDMFQILTWSADSPDHGDFDFFSNAGFSNGTQNLMFEEVFVNGGLDLAVVATPEPSTLAMLFGVMLLAGGVVWTRRRRNGIT